MKGCGRETNCWNCRSHRSVFAFHFFPLLSLQHLPAIQIFSFSRTSNSNATDLLNVTTFPDKMQTSYTSSYIILNISHNSSMQCLRISILFIQDVHRLNSIVHITTAPWAQISVSITVHIPFKFRVKIREFVDSKCWYLPISGRSRYYLVLCIISSHKSVLLRKPAYECNRSRIHERRQWRRFYSFTVNTPTVMEIQRNPTGTLSWPCNNVCPWSPAPLIDRFTLKFYTRTWCLFVTLLDRAFETILTNHTRQ
jgi:hypothetical protein